jgi:hypothetical protein
VEEERVEPEVREAAELVALLEVVEPEERQATKPGDGKLPGG